MMGLGLQPGDEVITASFTYVATADSTNQLLRDIKRLPVLTRSEEQELAGRIRTGDRAAVNALVEANIRFAVQVAKQYQGMGLQLEDLIGFANIGLF
jgi:RNA polymerase primary sigma factor